MPNESTWVAVSPKVMPLCGFWTVAVAVELASAAVADGTFPLVKRERCSPPRIVRERGLSGGHKQSISDAIKNMISVGLAQVARDKSGLVFNRDMVWCVHVAESKGGFSARMDDPLTGSPFDGPQPIENPAESDPKTLSTSLISKGIGTKKGSQIELIPPSSSSSRGRPKDPRPHELELFHLWRNTLGKNKRTKLDKARLRALRKALAPESARGMGFTLAEVKRAILGWCALCLDDDWRMEMLNRHELSLFLRDAGRVEQGLEEYEKRKESGLGGPGKPSRDRSVQEALQRRKQAKLAPGRRKSGGG